MQNYFWHVQIHHTRSILKFENARRAIFRFYFFTCENFSTCKKPLCHRHFCNSEKFSRKRALAFSKCRRALTLRTVDRRRRAFLSSRTPFEQRGKCFFRCAGVIERECTSIRGGTDPTSPLNHDVARRAAKWRRRERRRRRQRRKRARSALNLSA